MYVVHLKIISTLDPASGNKLIIVHTTTGRYGNISSYTGLNQIS